jgi:hypothetical protein
VYTVVVQEDTMKCCVRFFTLVAIPLCFALLAPFTLAAQSDDPPQTLTVGDSVEDLNGTAEFLLDAAEGQTVTLRWEGRHRASDRCDAPLDEMIAVETEITNADGDALTQTRLFYTPTSTIQVYTLQGAAPYHLAASICGGFSMTLTVIDGDAIAPAEQPALSIGETVTIDAATLTPDQLLVIPLNMQEGDAFTVESRFLNPSRSDDYPMYAVLVRDADGQVVASDFSARLPPELSLLAPVYTVTGAVPYRLEFVALPLYNAGYAERFGENAGDISYAVQLHPGNTAIEDRGVLAPGTTLSGDLSPGLPVMVTFDVDEGKTFTLRRQFSFGTPASYFLNADGYNADVVEFFVNDATGMNWVMQLAGSPPYVYYFSGEGSYSILLEEGNTLGENELGTLAPGGVLRGTVPPQNDSVDYITLDVNPDSTVTLNWGVPQTEFAIRDGAGNFLFPSNDDWMDGYAIVDLSQGTPPFVVSLDDARYAGQLFTFTLAEGETPLLPDGASAAQSDAADTATCTVSASSDINQRGGPGTNFDVSGTLAGGSSAPVDGQTTGMDGFTWYRLTTGGWVRSDLVTATAACSSVPQVDT